MRFAFLFVAALLFAAPAFAEEYEEGPNGGLMLDVAGIDAELLTSENTVTIDVLRCEERHPSTGITRLPRYYEPLHHPRARCHRIS